MFRRLSIADAADMAALHKMCFAKSWDQTEIRDLLQRSRAKAYGWKKGEQLCAFVLFTVVAPEADMITLATHPKHQGHGVASMLLASAWEDLSENGVLTVHLEVAQNNKPALQVYTKAGFLEVGRRKAYYQSASHKPQGAPDALMMTLHLDGKA